MFSQFNSRTACPVNLTAGVASRSYRQRREWAVTALRLAWLLHFAGALVPQGGTPAAVAVAAAAPASFRELATLAHMACADALMVLSLLFPVRTVSLRAFCVVARATLQQGGVSP